MPALRQHLGGHQPRGPGPDDHGRRHRTAVPLQGPPSPRDKRCVGHEPHTTHHTEEPTMNILRTLILTAATTLALGAGSAAHAETLEDMRFGDIAVVKMMDKNKDGMVSRAEFLEMMGKVYDMKAKQMKAKGGMMTSIEFDEFAKYLRAGS
jgi:hypothetical protein